MRMKRKSFLSRCCNIFIELQTSEDFTVYCPKCREKDQVEEMTFDEGAIKCKEQVAREGMK